MTFLPLGNSGKMAIMESAVVPGFSLCGQAKAQARCLNQKRLYDADFSPQLPRNSNDIMSKNHAELGKKTKPPRYSKQMVASAPTGKTKPSGY